MIRPITAILHPSSVLQGGWHLQGAQVAYLRRLASEDRESLDPTKPPPRTIVTPTLVQLEQFVMMTAPMWGAVSLDIENAGRHLICVGACALDLKAGTVGPTVVFWFRQRGGAPWWPTWEEHLECTRLLDLLLGHEGLTKVGHFIVQHDIPELEELGFRVRGEIVDTAVVLHNSHHELPKGLQFAATLFCGAPAWKAQVKGDPKEADSSEAITGEDE